MTSLRWRHEDVPLARRTVGLALRSQADQCRDRIYLQDRFRTLTYGQVNEEANRIANGLLRLTRHGGAKVALMLPNGATFVVAWLAIAKAGLVVVPINISLKRDLLAYALSHSDAEILICEETLLPAIAEVYEVSQLHTIVVVGKGNSKNGTAIQHITYEELLDESNSEPEVEVTFSDPVAIFYSGGTTGRSKGIVWPHHYALISSGAGIADLEFGAEHVFFNCLPLYNAILPYATLRPLISGGRLAIVERFSASRFWEDVRFFGATHTILVGSMFRILYNAERRADDSNNPLKYVRGNPMPRDIREAFEERFGCMLLESYSMTEAVPITANLPGDSRIGSCGKPVSGAYEVRLVDENDLPVPRNVVGQFVVRPIEPYSMMLEYYKVPQETLQAFRNLWFHTGDLGYQDEDGYYYHVGREKDSIRRRGVSISAFEVEEVINRHPSVRDSAVVSVPAEFGDEEIKAVVELKHNFSLTPEALLDFCQEYLPPFMVPRFIEFVHELPRTSLTRVEKHRLRDLTPGTWDREKSGYTLGKRS